MKRISIIIAAVIVGIVVTGGCVRDNSDSSPVFSAQQNAPQTVVPAKTVIPTLTVTTAPVSEYTTADVVFESGTEPAAGFTLEYPSPWTYGPERLSWPSRASPVYQVTGQDPVRYWREVYNFSSPDKRLYTHVYFDDTTGTGDYFYNMNTWADGVIRVMTRSYCLDGAGNPLEVNYCPDARVFYNAVLISNDPVTINGSFEARRLVFISPGDENYGRYTLYLVHAGQMQGYNFTVPDHPEVAVKVSGPAWDFGRGGQAYAIDYRTPAGQAGAATEIFSRMISSLQIQ